MLTCVSVCLNPSLCPGCDDQQQQQQKRCIFLIYVILNFCSEDQGVDSPHTIPFHMYSNVNSSTAMKNRQSAAVIGHIKSRTYMIGQRDAEVSTYSIIIGQRDADAITWFDSSPSYRAGTNPALTLEALMLPSSASLRSRISS